MEQLNIVAADFSVFDCAVMPLYAAETDFFQAFRNFFTLKLQREIDVMQDAMGTAVPELESLIQAGDTPEEERKSCRRDLDKLQHAMDYYSWLQRFVDGLEEGEVFGGPAGRT
ncbi:hypothetical protein PAECIP111892_05357 [Paenibacillus auburnensis]|uniref:Transcriptional regulator n=1 Tax=Paenibacillus auburnensis TaxID=2905649 RepID=A0ABM9CTH2_9BACL|nr:hypothetical protein [Paenibacillus auburnensis]CAH1223735.1 hypothetical protein PAECIP111892_05357 [Paenibacillus auburnensis]